MALLFWYIVGDSTLYSSAFLVYNSLTLLLGYVGTFFPEDKSLISLSTTNFKDKSFFLPWNLFAFFDGYLGTLLPGYTVTDLVRNLLADLTK